MKTLHIIRHAKSSWSVPGLADIDRPLNARGLRSSKLMAEKIKLAGCNFRHVFCSPARRAQMTIQIIADSLVDRDIQWVTDEALYTFSQDALVEWWRGRSNALDEVVMVGHNPAITEFCNLIGDLSSDNVPTCGYVQLMFPGGRWGEIGRGTASSIEFLYPKMYE